MSVMLPSPVPARRIASRPVSSPTAFVRELDAVIDAWVGDERIVGTVALVALDGEPVYRRAAGYADREAGIAVTEETIFRLASMTKLIVSAAAMALEARGRLDITDTVERWLPYFTPRLADGRKPKITIAQLMSHTSGLSYSFFEPDDDRYARAGISQGLEPFFGTLEDNLRRLASVPLFYEPGREWRYSLSTDVLGAVIERAADMPLDDAIARYVTQPLGMTDTVFLVRDVQRLAAPYLDGVPKARPMDPHCELLPIGTGAPFSPARAVDPHAFRSGGGGMSGTADDYLLLLEAIRRSGGPLFAAEHAAALTTHSIGELRAWTEGEGWGHGLGAAVLLDPVAAATPQSVGTWQWGGVLGSHWFVDPARRLTVVVLTNTALAGVIGDFPAAIRDTLYRSLFDIGGHEPSFARARK